MVLELILKKKVKAERQVIKGQDSVLTRVNEEQCETSDCKTWDSVYPSLYSEAY